MTGRRIALLVAVLAVTGCTPAQDADEAFQAFQRSCDPETITTTSTDLPHASRTFTATCKVLPR